MFKKGRIVKAINPFYLIIYAVNLISGVHLHSVREVEVIVSIVIILSLSDEGTDEVDRGWDPDHSKPNSAAKVNNPSLNEEFTSTTVQEMEEPLLGSVRSMMPDVTSGITGLLVEVLLSVPCSVLHSWYSKTFSVNESHIFHVTHFVVGESSSF